MCDHLSCVHRFSDLRNRIQDEYREVVERRLRTITGGEGRGGGGTITSGAGRGWGVDSVIYSFPTFKLCKIPPPSPAEASGKGVME